MTDFETLFENHRVFIFRYLIKLTRDPSLAEELTQETFFRAYINLSRLRNPNKAAAWLCQIAKNTYYAWYNDQKKHAPLDEALHTAEDIDVEEQYLRHDLSQSALNAVHALDEPYKEVFLLAVFGNVSLTDISRLFGKSESWARVTFYRAKQILANEMRNDV